jgi:hypothetical protein
MKQSLLEEPKFDQPSPLHTADQDIKLTPAESAQFDQIEAGVKDAAHLDEASAYAPKTEDLQKAPEAKTFNQDDLKTKSLGGLVGKAWTTGRDAVGRHLWAAKNVAIEKITNPSQKVEDKEKSGKKGRYAVMGGVAVAAAGAISFVAQGVAAAKGIDTGGAHEAIQPGMTGTSASSHSTEIANNFAPDNNIGDVNSSETVHNFSPDQSGNGNSGGNQANQNQNPTPPNPKDITLKAPKDPNAMLGDTWEMPEYKGPEDSVGAHMEKYLKNMFEANGIDPKTMTGEEKNAVIAEFMKENNITDQGNMHVGQYKTDATGDKLTQVVKEHIAKDMAAKLPPVPAELPKIGLNLEEAQKLGLDLDKMPANLDGKLNVKVERGDGIYSLFGRDETASKLSIEQQQELVQLLNSDKVRPELIKLAPESFYDYQYPLDYPDQGLAGTHELRLQYHEGQENLLLSAEKQKQVEAMYRNIIEGLLKEAAAKKTP